MESTSDVKQTFRLVYHLAKTIDEQLQTTKTIDEIFSPDLSTKRRKLRQKCEQILFLDMDVMARKSREIMWRQGCYNTVSKFKKTLVSQSEKNRPGGGEHVERMERFLAEVVDQYKEIIMKFELDYEIELRNIVDSEVLGVGTTGEQSKESTLTIEEKDYAQKTVQFFLIALGDIHRYLNDFESVPRNFNLALEYYRAAFALNPLNGMAQNQMGTLLIGRRYSVDSIFHYLFSLMCQIPFDLSETNLNKIFQKNIDYIETIEDQLADQTQLTLNTFISRFILIVDIFYFDKTVYDFNSLCHSILVELKKFLATRLADFDEELLFKLCSILLFCHTHLRLKNSEKIHNLNAFIVALVSELVDSTIRNIERDVLEYLDETSKFRKDYDRLYEETYNGGTKRSPVLNDVDEVARNGDATTEKVKITQKDRRRRRRLQSVSSDSNSMSDDGSDRGESEYETDSDDELEISSLSSLSGVDCEEEEDIQVKLREIKIEEPELDSDADVIVEEEKIMYFDENNEIVSEKEDVIDDSDEKLTQNTAKSSDSGCRSNGLPKYSKSDPNLIIKFTKNEKSLKSLKILFDWLRNNSEILLSCYSTNPEFIHKIMKLLNHLNVDIFTRTVFFDLKLITVDDLRRDLLELFESRHKIPLNEDIQLKGYTAFDKHQASLDWSANQRMSITKCEESFLRAMKLVDFGFFITKSHKFDYVFCKKTRSFAESKIGANKFRGERKSRRGRRRGAKRVRNRSMRGQNRERNGRNSRREERKPRPDFGREEVIVEPERMKADRNGVSSDSKENKYELMGKLWLRNEVKALESKIRKPANIHFTPYLVMDSKSLTEFTPIVRALVRTKKFIVLIPLAVFSELDELKKTSDGARHAIRWLEHEFKKGNRFIRSQRETESRQLPMIKIPKKLDRDSSTFVQIVQFCYYLVATNDAADDILTFVTGENLTAKKSTAFSYTGLLDSIGIKSEIISTFFAKYKIK